MEDKSKITAERLRIARNNKQWSYGTLSAETGFSKSTLQRYETGFVQSVPVERLKIIGAALDVRPEWLMGFDVPEKKEILPGNIIPLPQTKNIPLLGDIACGEPILATENIADYIKVDSSINVDFALRCKGDSMINARIFDGDIVYIRQQPDVDDGEIAAVLIGDEATLKKVYKSENKLVLRPCNPMYDDLVYSNDNLNDVKILGKAVMFTSLVRHGK